MAHGKYVREKEYNNIKLMQRAQLSTKEVAKITDRSKPTVKRIFDSNTWEDYQNENKRLTALIESRKATKVEPEAKPQVPVQATIYEDAFVQSLNSINEGLVGIRQALDSIDTRLTFLEEHVPVKVKRSLW